MIIIPTWLLKECSSVFIPTITNIVNLSLSFGQFHPLLKQSTISPLLTITTTVGLIIIIHIYMYYC